MRSQLKKEEPSGTEIWTEKKKNTINVIKSSADELNSRIERTEETISEPRTNNTETKQNEH